MSYSNTYGIYNLNFKQSEKQWTLKFFGKNPKELRNTQVKSCPDENTYCISLEAVGPISAFTRASSAILDYLEKKHDTR
jgi:hypothetical protein